MPRDEEQRFLCQDWWESKWREKCKCKHDSAGRHNAAMKNASEMLPLFSFVSDVALHTWVLCHRAFSNRQIEPGSLQLQIERFTQAGDSHAYTSNVSSLLKRCSDMRLPGSLSRSGSNSCKKTNHLSPHEQCSRRSKWLCWLLLSSSELGLKIGKERHKLSNELSLGTLRSYEYWV